MMVMTAKVDKKKILIILAAVVVVIAGIFLILGTGNSTPTASTGSTVIAYGRVTGSTLNVRASASTSGSKPSSRKLGVTDCCRQTYSSRVMTDKSAKSAKLTNDLISSVRTRKGMNLIYYYKFKSVEESN